MEDLRRKTVVECVLFMLCLLALTPPLLLFFVTFAQDQRVCVEGLGKGKGEGLGKGLGSGLKGDCNGWWKGNLLLSPDSSACIS